MKMTQELLRNLIREEVSKNLPASGGENNPNEPASAAGGEPSGEEGMSSAEFHKFLLDYIKNIRAATGMNDKERANIAKTLKDLSITAQKADMGSGSGLKRGLKAVGGLFEEEEPCEKCGKSPCECDETEESIEQAISANKNDVTITRFKESKEDLDELIKEIILSTITKNK